MDITEKDEECVIPLTALNSKQVQFLSQISQDIRATVSHLSLPDVSALSVLDATAIDGLKDLYYALNSEDPLNAMPVRRHVLTNNIPMDCLVPIAVAADSDPAAQRNQKRWSLPTYQTLRLFSVLTLPIASDSELPAPAQLDYLLLDLRFRLASHRNVLATYVSLLQYYVDRKSEKRAALLPAEDSKVEDARIDNILRFFCNILSPPREKVGEAINQRDREVHLALVGSLAKVDFFSTLAVLFSSEEDSHAYYTDLIFLVADIYALAFRHSSPMQMIRALRSVKADVEKTIASKIKKDPVQSEPPSVFDEPSMNVFDEKTTGTARPEPSIAKVPIPRSTGLRDALLLERATIGGSRAATVGARWTSRHSGGFSKAIRKPGGDGRQLKSARNPNGIANTATKQIISAKGAVLTNKAFNSKHAFQESVRINSELLCLLSAKKRSAFNTKALKQALPTVRHDLQEDGLKGLVSLTTEMIDVSFQYFVRELRGRIVETRERAQGDEAEALRSAERAYLTIVGSVVGFHREKCGKVYKTDDSNEDEGSTYAELSSQLHKNDIKSILSKDFKIVKTAWKEVEAAIELESFQMVFGILADAIYEVRESTSRDFQKIKLVELSTFSVLEMLKMLQGMAAVVSKDIEEAEEGKQGNMTPRELALNTLEELFEREMFLNAPADLAKTFNTKMFSFQHLSNIVEMAHAFTTILLDEQELSRIAVVKRKKKKRTKTIINNDHGETNVSAADETAADENLIAEKDGAVDKSLKNNDDIGNQTGNNGEKDIVLEPTVNESGDKPVEGVSGPTMNDGDKVPEANGNSHDESSPNGHEVDGNTLNGSGSEDQVGKENEFVNTETNENKTKDPPKEMTSIEMMLQADEEDLRKVEKEKPVVLKTKKPPPTTVEEMLQVDEQAVVEGIPQPKYVSNLDGGEVNPNDLSRLQVTDEDKGDEHDDEGLVELESIGIVRRFAHIKAIETLLIPLRSALCEANGLTGGKVFPKPDGAEAVTGPTLVAKSASVIGSIWKVALLRERGALCGQFFSFNVLQLLGIALSAESDGGVSKKSVLAHLAALGKDITDVFFKWLAVNPGLMYDMFLIMDKSYAMSFARKVNKDEAPAERKQRGRLHKLEVSDKWGKHKSDSAKIGVEDAFGNIPSSPDMWNDSELAGDYSSDDDAGNSGGQQKKKYNRPRPKIMDDDEDDVDDLDKLEFGTRHPEETKLSKKRKRGPKNKRTVQSKRQRRRRGEKTDAMLEDEDVDDLDALRFGPESSDESDEKDGGGDNNDNGDNDDDGDARVDSTVREKQRTSTKPPIEEHESSDEYIEKDLADGNNVDGDGKNAGVNTEGRDDSTVPILPISAEVATTE